jgi:hypothetical protein
MHAEASALNNGNMHGCVSAGRTRASGVRVRLRARGVSGPQKMATAHKRLPDPLDRMRMERRAGDGFRLFAIHVACVFSADWALDMYLAGVLGFGAFAFLFCLVTMTMTNMHG